MLAIDQDFHARMATIFVDVNISRHAPSTNASVAVLVHEQVELTSLDAGIKNNTQQTMKINETLTSDTLEGQGIDISMKKFAQLVNTIEDRLASTKTVAQELQDVLDAEQQLKSIDESVLTTSRQHNAAGMVSAMQGSGRIRGKGRGPLVYQLDQSTIDHASHSRQSPVSVPDPRRDTIHVFGALNYVNVSEKIKQPFLIF